MSEQLTRRRLVAIGTTAVIGTAGLALGTDRSRASASVGMGTLGVSNGDFSPANGKLAEVWVVEPESGTRWTLNREPFECRLREGSITEVVPNWEPAGEVVVA